ncbi:hypothetical protein G4B88_019764, partial [Cannabis sativa]
CIHVPLTHTVEEIFSYNKIDLVFLSNHQKAVMDYGLLLLYFLLTLLSNLCFADPPYTRCSNTTSNYTDNSLFQSNLQNLLATFPSNASTLKFHTSIMGEKDADKVYGVYMCLNYVNDQLCHDCIATAAQDVLTLCHHNSKEAVVWEELCQLRYSNDNFFGKLSDDTGDIPLRNLQNISQPEEFKSFMTKTLRNLTQTAAYNHDSFSYATGEVSYMDKTVYALVQCSRDLSPDDCKDCLGSATEEILDVYYYSIGARLLSRSCYLRYELYAFYMGESSASMANDKNKEGNNENPRQISRGQALELVDPLVIDSCDQDEFVRYLQIGLMCVQKDAHERPTMSSVVVMLNGESTALCQPKPPAFPMGRFIVDSCSINSVTVSILIISTFSNAHPLYTFCSPDQGNYTPNSQFETNLKTLLDHLSSNTTLNGSLPGYFYTSIGNNSSDKVYGQSLCRGDVNSTVCGKCVEDASQDIFRNCKSIDAIIWYELCQVRYSFQMFFSTMQVYTGKFPKSNEQDKNVSVDRTRFSKVMMHMMKNLSDEVAFTPSKNMFATGKIEFSREETVYGMLQCTLDMPPRSCSSCLAAALGDLNACCSFRRGGIVLSRNCYVRFGMDHFYNDTLSPLLVYPSSTGKHFNSNSKVAWRLWEEGKELEFVDPLVIESSTKQEILKCIRIGLLCVQEDPEDRPTMSSVVASLQQESEPVPLSEPKQPFAFAVSNAVLNNPSTIDPTLNGLTFSAILPPVTLLLAYCFLRGQFVLVNAAYLPVRICNTNNTLNNNSHFPTQNSLYNLFHSLASTASVSKFYNTSSSGVDSDKVYGLYMCLGYATNEDCKNCISLTSKEIMGHCPNSPEAVIWEEKCMIRYSNTNFLGSVDVSENLEMHNLINASEPKQLGSALEEMLNELIEKAAYNHSPIKYYAADKRSYGNDIVYAVVQCTEDLSPTGCKTCLKATIENASTCCSFSKGVRILSKSCFLRYELYDFYEDDSEIPPSGFTKTTFTIKDMVKVTISSAVISVFVLAFYFHKPVNSNPLLSDCIPTTVSYTSSFEHNLKTLLKSLVNNTPSSTGYKDTSYGDGLDQVYGQALCRGDVNVTDCQKCLESASQGIMNKCKTTRAIIWYEVCQIHYFPYDFRKMQIYAGKKPEKSYHRKKVAHPDQFRLAWTKLIKKLSDEAINDSNGTMFKTGDTEYSKGKIYGLVQCTRDIPKRECKICLRSALGDIQGFFPSEEGGIILSNLRSSVSSTPKAPKAWQLWREGKEVEFVDPLMMESSPTEDIIRCMHIGLLCVQEDPNDRPTMSSVVVLLGSGTVSLPQPRQPAFCVPKVIPINQSSFTNRSTWLASYASSASPVLPHVYQVCDPPIRRP